MRARANPACTAPTSNTNTIFLTFFLLFAALKLNVFSLKLRMYAYVLTAYVLCICRMPRCRFFPSSSSTLLLKASSRQPALAIPCTKQQRRRDETKTKDVNARARACKSSFGRIETFSLWTRSPALVCAPSRTQAIAEMATHSAA